MHTNNFHIQQQVKTSNKTTNKAVSAKNTDKLTLCFWNGQSIKDKTHIIKDFRIEHDIDIYLITETWLSDTNHTRSITDLKDNNTCKFINYPRPYSG